MMHYWCSCLVCDYQWIASFVSEFGFLVAMHTEGENCPECGGDVEIGEEYDE